MSDTLSNTVDETLRRRFEASWASGEPKLIEDCLPARDAPFFLGTLAELVHIELEFAWKAWSASRHHAETLVLGEVQHRPDTIENYLARFPDLSQPEVVLRLLQHEFYLRRRLGDGPTIEEYRRRFPDMDLGKQTLDTTATFETVTDAAVGSADAQDAGAFAGQYFGDYKLLAEVGRGGMGVVYRALQRGTDRLVALKVIRADRMESLPPDSQSSLSERFRQEAQAAAQLAHDNIVTVYEVGQQDGLAYYSMRYVEGPSLAEILRTGPLGNRQAAAYTQAVARAVHSAHEAGILHRDLKPQNIMLDPKTDRVLVADFGLAKLVTAAEQLTHAGEVVGTPNYMAPEQARDAASVTAAADIYGVGATLYHLLTGRPPFQAATAVETLRQVMDDEPAPPSQLNPAVDRDLETICLKCLHKEPSRRYATAGLCADDLAHYLKGEPITARPISAFSRTVRWCRRNPVTAGWMGVAVASLLLALLACGVGYVRTSAALAKSEQSYRETRATVDYFYTQASENVLLNVPGLQTLRRDLLQRALSHYQNFVARRANDADARQELGRARFRVAFITEEIESPQAALLEYERARQVQEKIHGRKPEDTVALQDLGKTLNAIGRVQRRMQHLDASLISLEAARKIRERLVQRVPGAPEHRRTLANTLMNIGVVRKAQGKLDTARTQMEEAQRLRNELIGKSHDSPDILRDLGMGYYNLGTLALAASKLEAAEQHLQKAIAVFRDVNARVAADLANQARLALCYRMLAHVQMVRAATLAHNQAAAEAQAVRSEALLQYQQALALNRALAAGNPHVVDYQHQLAAVFLELGRLHLEQQQPDQAAEAFGQAVGLLKPIADNAPDSGRDFAVALRELGVAQLRLEKPAAAALEHLELSRQTLERLTAEFATNEDYRRDLEETRRVIDTYTASIKQVN